jgi:hypothetical protein
VNLQIESDKKHEELIAKWKKQLELKAKAFENLQKTFAPPRDLDQLRMQIQDELEEPNRQRIEQLQQEIEKHREIAFGLRRECEIVKTEYEQFAVDQGNEMECLHATYEMKLNELKRKLEVADECVYAAQNSDAVRKLEQQRTAAQAEIKLLHDEIKVGLLSGVYRRWIILCNVGLTPPQGCARGEQATARCCCE